MKNYLDGYKEFREKYLNSTSKVVEQNENEKRRDLNQIYKFFSNRKNLIFLNEMLDNSINDMDLILESENVDEDDLDMEDIMLGINVITQISKDAELSESKLLESENLYEYELIEESLKDIMQKSGELVKKLYEKLKTCAAIRFNKKKKKYVGVASDYLNFLIYKEELDKRINPEKRTKIIISDKLKNYISKTSDKSYNNIDFDDAVIHDEKGDKNYKAFKKAFGDDFDSSGKKSISEGKLIEINESDESKITRYNPFRDEESLKSFKLIDTDTATKYLQRDVERFLVTSFHTKIFDAKYRNKDKYSKEDLTNLSKKSLEYQKRTKTPILFVGAPGCGKTSIVRSMKDIYDQSDQIAPEIAFTIWTVPLVSMTKVDMGAAVREEFMNLSGEYFENMNAIYNSLEKKAEKEIKDVKDEYQMKILKFVIDMTKKASESNVVQQVPNFILPLYHESLGDMGNDSSSCIIYDESVSLDKLYDFEFKNPHDTKKGLNPPRRKPDCLQYATMIGGGIVFFDEYLRASDDVKASLMELIAGGNVYQGNYRLGDRWIIVAATNTPSEVSKDYASFKDMIDKGNIDRWRPYFVQSFYEVWKNYLTTESEFAGLEGTTILIEFMDHFIKDENKVVEGSSSDPFKIEFMSYNPETGFIATTRGYERIAMELEYSKGAVKDKLDNTYEGSIFDLDLEQFLIFLDSVDATALSIPAFNDSGFSKVFKDYIETTYAMTKILDKKFSTDLFYTDKQSELSISNLVAKIENFYKSAKLEIDVKSTTLFMIQRLVRMTAPYKTLPEDYYIVSGNKSIVNTDKILDDIRNKNYKNILTVDECKNINAWISGCTTEFTPFKGEFQKIFALAHPYLITKYVENTNKVDKELYTYLKNLENECKFLDVKIAIDK